MSDVLVKGQPGVVVLQHMDDPAVGKAAAFDHVLHDMVVPVGVHPQVAAPGYAMYYIWVIRHLEGNPYIKPDFEAQHLWVEQPGAKYWPDR